MNQSQLLAGAAVTDITPPLEVGLLTSSVNGTYAPFESVRLPLKARVLVLKSGSEQVAIVAVDLLTINDTSVFGWENFKQGMAGAVPAKNIIVCCTHTHCAPESVALSGLYLTQVYQNWLKQVQANIKEAINTACAEAKACNVSVATSKLDGYNMQRRIKTSKGIVMSDAMQPIAPAILNLPPVDRRVTSIHLHDNEGRGIATVVHAICHPVHEMCLPHISSEFPGEMCIELERSAGQGMAMFLNGAAGDTNPPTVSMGPEYAGKHGQALAKTVQNAEHKLLFDASSFTKVSGKIQLSIRENSNMDNELDALARLNAIRLGPLAIVFLPGEPFVETAFEIEKLSPFEHTLVVGYSENNIGYLPTEEAFEQGGYEAGPGKWSFLEKGTDHIIRNKALWLLNELYNN